jgi:hypothetical protein
VNVLRKIIFWVFVIASIGIAIWGYFRLKESKAPKVNVLEHIPGNAMCIIETKNTKELISQLTRQNLIWNSLLSQESMQVTHNGIQYLDSLVNSRPEIAEVLIDNSIYWSFLKAGKTTEHLILFKVKETSEKDLFKDFFTTSFSKDPAISSFDAFYFTNNKQKWIVCYKDGIVYLSSDLLVLQNAMELKKSESIAFNPHYLQLMDSNGEQETLLYLDHTQSALFPRNLFSKRSLFGSKVQLNAITLTGNTQDDSLSLFHCLKLQKASKFKDVNNLPQKAVSIQGVLLSDPFKFYEEVTEMLPEKLAQKNENAWRQLNDSAMYDIRKEVYENLDGEVLSARYSLNDTLYEMMCLRIEDPEKGKVFLKLMSDSVETGGEFRLNSELSDVFLYSESDLQMRYGYISGDFMILFSDRNLLRFYLSCKANGQLLINDPHFTSYAKEHLSLECNYLYYEDSELLKTHNLNSLINSEVLWAAENPTSQISLTAKNAGDEVQVRLNASHAPNINRRDNPQQNLLWSFQADSAINSPAYIFKNHLTLENEVCFQDNAKQIYLISSTGNLIWKKKISETIQSEIFTVDIFKNGKLQLLFNSENYLHLIDRNGNYVQGFPGKLPAKVTSDLTVLDYDNSKDYRLFIACADRRIYNFSLYGIRTEGFTPVKTEAEVNSPIHYVKVGASDYLVAIDRNGKIYAFSRKGEGRIDFKNRVIKDVGNVLVLAGTTIDHTKLVFVDGDNRVLNKISLSDRNELTKIDEELHGFKSTFGIWNDDNQPDILLTGKGGVCVYDLFGGKLLKFNSEGAEYDHAQVVVINNQKWLIAFDKKREKVDVLSGSGELISFLPGASLKPLVSDLYRNGKYYALLINQSSISCSELPKP